MIYLITGKPGSGKTTYADRLALTLVVAGSRVRRIDGDKWRQSHKNEDFSEAGRILNLESAAQEAGKAEAMGIVVILSFVAPKKQYREMMARYWEEWIVVHIPGGELWEGTEYEVPDVEELRGGHNG